MAHGEPFHNFLLSLREALTPAEGLLLDKEIYLDRAQIAFFITPAAGLLLLLKEANFSLRRFDST